MDVVLLRCVSVRFWRVDRGAWFDDCMQQTAKLAPSAARAGGEFFRSPTEPTIAGTRRCGRSCSRVPPPPRWGHGSVTARRRWRRWCVTSGPGSGSSSWRPSRARRARRPRTRPGPGSWRCGRPGTRPTKSPRYSPRRPRRSTAPGWPRYWRRRASPDCSPARMPSAGLPRRDAPARTKVVDFARLARLLRHEGGRTAAGRPGPGRPGPARHHRPSRLPGHVGDPSVVSSLLSLLALKLTDMRRVSHVDDLATDPGAALFAGLTSLPKATALTTYSYRLDHTRQVALLKALDKAAIAAGLVDGEVLNLDFHAIMHWGQDVALEKNYVPRRSQRTRSVLTFFAEDAARHTLVYANADLSKATQNGEVLAFCDHWRTVTGHDPALLIMDSKVTTQEELGKLTDRGIAFITLRARTPTLTRTLAAQPKQRLDHGHRRPRRRQHPPRPGHRRPRRHPVLLPRHPAPARRRRPGPRGTHHPRSPTASDPSPTPPPARSSSTTPGA